MLNVDAVSFMLGRHTILAPLSFVLSAGSILEVRGANGRGKSTLLRILAGLLQPTTGSVAFHPAVKPLDASLRWHDKNRVIPAKAGIQGGRKLIPEGYRSPSLLYIGHQLGVKSLLTPIENILLDPRLSVDQKRVSDALIGWGLSQGAMKRPAGTLSRGQQQRVALAKLSLTDAPIWLLDEPFTALDTDSVTYCEQVLEEHASRGGVAVVATHRPLALSALERITL